MEARADEAVDGINGSSSGMNNSSTCASIGMNPLAVHQQINVVAACVASHTVPLNTHL